MFKQVVERREYYEGEVIEYKLCYTRILKQYD